MLNSAQDWLRVVPTLVAAGTIAVYSVLTVRLAIRSAPLVILALRDGINFVGTPPTTAVAYFFAAGRLRFHLRSLLGLVIVAAIVCWFCAPTVRSILARDDRATNYFTTLTPCAPGEHDPELSCLVGGFWCNKCGAVLDEPTASACLERLLAAEEILTESEKQFQMFEQEGTEETENLLSPSPYVPGLNRQQFKKSPVASNSSP